MCDTEIEVPMCCQGSMEVKKGVLVCVMCGNDKSIPICCGKEMKVVASE